MTPDLHHNRPLEAPSVDARDEDLFPRSLRAPAFRLLWVVAAVLIGALALVGVAYLRSVS